MDLSLPLDNESNYPKKLNDSNKHIDYSKYINLTKEETLEKINEKKKKIIEYYNTNKSLKNELTNILEKLNSFTNDNKNEFYSHENSLKDKLNNKKIEYMKNKSDNTRLKYEYDILLKRVKEISEKKLSNIFTEKRFSIDKLKEENFEIKKEINKKQIESAKTQNQVIKIRNNNLYLFNLDLHSFKLKKYMDSKNNYIKAFNMSNRMLKEKINEVKNLENIVKTKSNLFTKNENAYNKLKEDINKIKSDIFEVIDEINKNDIEEDLLTLNRILQKNETSTNENTISNINYDSTNKVSSDIFITKSSPFTASDPKKNSKNKRFLMNYNKQNLKPILRKNNSLSFLSFKVQYGFRNNLNCNLENNSRQINLLSSQNNISNNITTLNTAADKSRKFYTKKSNNCFSYDFSKINFKETDDETYHNLLNKKENYMEVNDRISNNIKETNKAFENKYNKISNNLKKNINKLNEIKIINRGLQTEIKQLQDLMIAIKEENKKNSGNKGS